ncbi:phosphoribosylanthranilate isomerase [Candidatus Latescibacterota bacterium]
MIVKVKICGITRVDDAWYAEEYGASAVGFIFYPPSPRAIDPDGAGIITEALGPFIAKVGVFVDEDPGKVITTVKAAGLTAVQLHGSESPEYVSELQALASPFKLQVIKAFRVDDDFNPGELGKYSAGVFLLDTYDPDQQGGTGKTFDWEKAVDCEGLGKIILAGGLNADNIAEAIQTAHPWGVDISSGVESSPGVKDHEKLMSLFDSIQGSV